MDVSIQDIRMECLKLAVYSGDESPDVCLALSERYVDYVQHGPRKPAKVLDIAEAMRQSIKQSQNQNIVANGPPGSLDSSAIRGAAGVVKEELATLSRTLRQGDVP